MADFALLRSLDPSRRQMVISTAHRCRFCTGDTVFHEGEQGSSLHLIESGRVAVRCATPAGDTATLVVLGRGEAFGEIALVRADARRTASVVALEPTETLVIGRAEFEDLRRREPSVDRFLVDALAAEVARLSAQLVEAYFLPAETRVLRRLALLSDVYQTPSGEVTIPLRQEAIAMTAGTSRATVNRVLRGLEVDGLVRLGRGRLTVVDPDRVAERAS